MTRAVLAIVLVLSWTSTLSAQAGTPPAAAAGPAAPSAHYLARMGQGLTAIRTGDRAGALAAFRDAAQHDANRPDAICLVAELQRASDQLNDALEGFRSCLRVARSANAPRWQARALHGIASTLERIDGRLAEARTAWQEYTQFADANATVSHPTIGRARSTTIDAIVELDRVSAEVRQRIEERVAHNAAQAQRGSSSGASEGHGGHSGSHSGSRHRRGR